MRLTTEEAVLRYRKALFAAAFSVCRDRDDADDAVQEALLRYHTHPVEFTDENHLKAWLLRVTVNCAHDITSAFWRRHRETLEDFAETLSFEAPEDRGVFAAAMGLPEKYRVVVHLFYYEGYSVREIGDILHLRENTVKSRLDRGRKLLKNTLKEDWENE